MRSKSRRLFGSAAALAGVFSPVLALAQEGIAIRPGGLPFGATEVIQFSVFAGVMGAALLSAVWLIRERGRIAAENGELRGRIADLSASLQRSEALLNLRDQRVVVWSNDSSKAAIRIKNLRGIEVLMFIQ